MKWRMQFYNERRGILAHYTIDALLPAEAVRLGWRAVLAEHALTPRRGRPSLLELAERVGGQHGTLSIDASIARRTPTSTGLTR